MDLIKSTSRIFVARTISTFLGFIGITIFARQLGASGIGEFFLFQASLGVLSIIADFGLRGAAEKRISEGDLPGEYFSTVLILKFVTITVVVSGVYGLLAAGFPIIDSEIALYVVVGVVLQESSQLLIQNLNAEHRVAETAPIILIKQLTWVGLGASLLYIGYKTRGIIIAYLVGIAISAIISGYKTQTPLGMPSLRATKSLINYAKYDAILGSGYNLLSWLDVLVIGYFLSSQFVGAYEMAWKIAAISVLLSRSIYTSIFPEISALDIDSDRKEISQTISDMLIPSVYLVIPALFGILFLSEELLRVLFGNEYTIASTVLVIFMLQKVIVAYDNVIGRSLQALNFPEYAAYSMIGSICINITLNIILVYQYGILGGAVATLLATVSMAAIRTRYLSKLLKIDLLPQPIIWCSVVAISMAFLLYLMKRFIVINSLPVLLCVIIVAAGWYLSISLYSKKIRQILLPAN